MSLLKWLVVLPASSLSGCSPRIRKVLHATFIPMRPAYDRYHASKLGMGETETYIDWVLLKAAPDYKFRSHLSPRSGRDHASQKADRFGGRNKRGSEMTRHYKRLSYEWSLRDVNHILADLHVVPHTWLVFHPRPIRGFLKLLSARLNLWFERPGDVGKQSQYQSKKSFRIEA